MTELSTRDRTIPQNHTLQRPLLVLAIVLLCLGLFFRVANLEHKVFWVDEVATSIRIAGHTAGEVTEDLVRRQVVTPADLLQYQQLQPSTSWEDTIGALVQSPEHAPLYFLMARLWVQLFGNSVAALRSLSVILGLLALPAIYWLCVELFQSARTGWISLMLLSVSPFYVAYSQEARPYSLWTVTVLLASLALLRAVRLDNRWSWLSHTIAITLSFYTSLLSLLVVIGQGLYVIAREKVQLTQTVRNFLVSLGLAIVAFLPWLLVILNHFQALQDNTTWMRVPMNLPAMIAIWIAPILLTFGDLPISYDLNPVKVIGILGAILVLMVALSLLYTLGRKSKKTSGLLGITMIVGMPLILISSLLVVFADLPLATILDPVAIGGIVTALLVLTLVGYSLYYLWPNTDWNQQFFLLSFAFIIPVILILIDVLLKGQSSATPRYMIPMQIGIQLAVSHTIASHFSSSNIHKQKIWRVFFALLVSLAVFSCCLNLTKSPIHQKNRSLHNIPISDILNQAKSPILISESKNSLDLLSMSHYLHQKNTIRIFYSYPKTLSISNELRGSFLFNPSQELLFQISKNKKISISQSYIPKVFIPGEISLSLWRIHAHKDERIEKMPEA